MSKKIIITDTSGSPHYPFQIFHLRKSHSELIHAMSRDLKYSDPLLPFRATHCRMGKLMTKSFLKVGECWKCSHSQLDFFKSLQNKILYLYCPQMQTAEADAMLLGKFKRQSTFMGLGLDLVVIHKLRN